MTTFQKYFDVLADAFEFGCMGNKAKTRAAINAAYSIQMGYAIADGTRADLKAALEAVVANAK